MSTIVENQEFKIRYGNKKYIKNISKILNVNSFRAVPNY